jgi:hypothetical protein
MTGKTNKYFTKEKIDMFYHHTNVKQLFKKYVFQILAAIIRSKKVEKD